MTSPLKTDDPYMTSWLKNGTSLHDAVLTTSRLKTDIYFIYYHIYDFIRNPLAALMCLKTPSHVFDSRTHFCFLDNSLYCKYDMNL